MHVQERPIESVRPYEHNPRHNDAAVGAVAASIREFGFRQPIVVDEQGVIVVGHTRYKAALKLGLKAVPVHVATGLSPAQVKAYRLADNQAAALSSWDDDKLARELGQLQGPGIDLGLTGFAAEELLRLLAPPASAGLTDPDDVPAPPDEAVAQPGDLWLLGRHRLLCGDSSRAGDVDRLVGGEAVHLVNTDPPYNVRVEPRSRNAIAAGLSSFPAATAHRSPGTARPPGGATKPARKLRAKDRPLANDFVSDQEFGRLLRAWFGNLARVLLPGRAFYVWGGYSNIGSYPRALAESGLYFAQQVIWVKGHPVLTRKDFMATTSGASTAGAGAAAHQYFGPANATDVWEVKKVSPQGMVHLTEKPVELAARALEYSSRPGEHVLDLLRGDARQALLLCSRQAGKSLTAAGLALRAALLDPPALVLLLSPSQRQSGELFRDKVLRLYNARGRPVPAAQQTQLELGLANGSRLVSLPGDEGTLRGYSGVALLVIDEAARVPDALYYAVRPMLAVSGGRLVALSTPFGQRGWFHQEWQGPGDWQRVRVTAEQCPRIGAAFLAEERRALGERWYRQEYLCSFEDTVDAVFAYADIQAALSEEVRPLFP